MTPCVFSCASWRVAVGALVLGEVITPADDIDEHALRWHVFVWDLQRGIARGDLRADADYELANELLFGPVYYRLLLSGGKLDDELAARVVGAVWPAFAATDHPD